MNKKRVKLLSTVCVLSVLLIGCSEKKEDSTTTNTTQTETKDSTKQADEKVSMQYIEKEELKEAIDSNSDEYVILDARKIEDYNAGHIKGSFPADQDAANKGGDNEKGIENLKSALKEASGSEEGKADDKYALVCYSGKSYAEKATELLEEMGVPKENIYTLKGGMKDWEKGGDEYKSLVNPK